MNWFINKKFLVRHFTGINTYFLLSPKNFYDKIGQFLEFSSPSPTPSQTMSLTPTISIHQVFKSSGTAIERWVFIWNVHEIDHRDFDLLITFVKTNSNGLHFDHSVLDTLLQQHLLLLGVAGVLAGV